MKIWELVRLTRVLGETRKMIAVAASETLARKDASDKAGPEGSAAWLAGGDATCDKFGDADSGVPSGVRAIEIVC